MMIQEEYLKLVDVVSSFDSNLITVKSWGVTLGLAALGFGFKEKNWGYFPFGHCLWHLLLDD